MTNEEISYVCHLETRLENVELALRYSEERYEALQQKNFLVHRRRGTGKWNPGSRGYQVAGEEYSKS